MQRVQLDSKDGLAAGWIGVDNTHNLPERAPSARSRAPRATRAHSKAGAGNSTTAPANSLLRATVRFARNAAIGLALLTAVPFAVIGVAGGRFQRYETISSRLLEKLQSSEHLRAFRAPIDAAITPEEAGLAFRALQARQPQRGFPMRGANIPYARPWKTRPLTASMFSGVRNPATPTILWPSQMLYAASSELSEQELSYLRAVAEAPVWQEFDRVASAAEVDIIGGQFVLPFSDNAFAPGMPIVRFADTRELANAAITRAAYYVAIRDFDRAEATLKSVVSFGFMLMDNATSAVDATLGRVITGVGGEGLLQLYSIKFNEPLMAAVRTPKELAFRDEANAKLRIDPAQLRARLLSDANNPEVPRGIRLESLRSLSLASCGNVSEVLLGPGEDVLDAYRNAKQSLARYPSEQAYLDLMFHATERVPDDAGVALGPERFIVGAATVAGVLLNNPRVAACTRMAMLSY